MPKKPDIDSQHAINHDQEIVKPNTFLETEKDHKKWYDANNMGKQQGRPKLVPRETKKPSGTKKHSLRKER